MVSITSLSLTYKVKTYLYSTTGDKITNLNGVFTYLLHGIKITYGFLHAKHEKNLFYLGKCEVAKSSPAACVSAP
jgi:hypothetical protein